VTGAIPVVAFQIMSITAVRDPGGISVLHVGGFNGLLALKYMCDGLPLSALRELKLFDDHLAWAANSEIK
jgi:hypothetical protein